MVAQKRGQLTGFGPNDARIFSSDIVRSGYSSARRTSRSSKEFSYDKSKCFCLKCNLPPDSKSVGL